MENNIKHYVEIIYDKIFLDTPKIEEVEKRDPTAISNNGFIHCIRFFDKEDNSDERKNYSVNIFFGERWTLEEIKLIYSENEHKFSNLINEMEKNNIESVCYTQTRVYVAMNDEDLTYDEYIAEIEKEGENKSQAKLVRKPKKQRK